MFFNDCFGYLYHEIFITRQSYIYINLFMDTGYSFFFLVVFFLGKLPVYATTARPDLAYQLGFKGAKFPLPYGPADGNDG